TLSVTNTFIGSQDGGSGTVTVSGNSASLTTGVLGIGGVQSSAGGAGTLNISAEATVAANDVEIWGGGTVNLDGGTLTTFTFNNNAGHFNFNSGTVHFTGSYSGLYG